jgi:vacuolar-type H+-ATPase subunit E/Vma4
MLVSILAVACDNSDRNERIADVQKKPPEEDPAEKAKAEARKAERQAKEKAKADAEEAVRQEITKIAVAPDKLPKKLDEACQAVADAHDGFMQRTKQGEALAAWNAGKEEELPMTFVQCAGADSIPAAACEKAALDAASPALVDHVKEIAQACITKYAPARPATLAGGGGGGGVPTVPKKGPR